MYPFSIGVILDSFRLPFEEAIPLAAKIGAQGLQVYATYGDMAPEAMTDARCREFLSRVKDNGLVLSALCGDLGRGFDKPDLNPELVVRSKRILDLALKLETNIVTTHIGVVPQDPSDPTYHIMQDACGELAAYADSLSAHFAVETGPEPAVRLKGFLDSLDSKGVAVNLDPANFVMVTGDDPVQAVFTLKDYIVHTHAKDGVMLNRRSANEIYGETNGESVKDGVAAYEELPLGKGAVPFPAYLSALNEIGFRGFLTIEREVGDDPVGDIADAVRFLKERI